MDTVAGFFLVQAIVFGKAQAVTMMLPMLSLGNKITIPLKKGLDLELTLIRYQLPIAIRPRKMSSFKLLLFLAILGIANSCRTSNRRTNPNFCRIRYHAPEWMCKNRSPKPTVPLPGKPTPHPALVVSVCKIGKWITYNCLPYLCIFPVFHCWIQKADHAGQL